MEVEHNSPPLKCGMHIVTFFQRVQYGRRMKRSFTVEKPDIYHLSQLINRPTLREINHVVSIYPWYEMVEMTLSLSHPPSPTCNPSLVMSKTSDKPHLKNIVQNTWNSCTIQNTYTKFLKIVRVTQNQEIIKNSCSQELLRLAWCKYSVVSWVGS